jgi:hypothetical protein
MATRQAAPLSNTLVNQFPGGPLPLPLILWFEENMDLIGDKLDFAEGTITGDILRWDDVDEVWEAVSEPFEFKGIILTPMLAALIDTEGSVFYSSVDKAVMVYTEV